MNKNLMFGNSMQMGFNPMMQMMMMNNMQMMNGYGNKK